MATAQPTMTTEGAYLNRFDFEPDAEFSDGVIEERPMGTIDHARWQAAISYWFRQHEKQWQVESLSEVRLTLRPGLHRIPDVTILDLRSGKAEGKTVTTRPIAVFEVFSPEESMKQLRIKFAEYDFAGIPHIWFVDPDKGVWQRYVDGVLTPTESFIHDEVIDFDMSEINALVRK